MADKGDNGGKKGSGTKKQPGIMKRDENSVNQKLERLRPAIRHILSHTASVRVDWSYSRRFQDDVESVIRKGAGKNLYEMIREELNIHIDGALTRLIQHVSDIDFVTHVGEFWTIFYEILLMLEKFGKNVNKTLDVPDVCGMGYGCLGYHLKKSGVAVKCMLCILKWYKGEEISTSSVSSILNLLVECDIFSELCSHHLPTILEDFTKFMDGNNIIGLGKIYKIFSFADALPSLMESFDTYIRSRIFSMHTMVPRLMEYYDDLYRIYEQSFSENEAFINTTKDAFRHIINSNQNDVSELIAKCFNENLRQARDEYVFYRTLNKLLVLFKFLESKDLFAAFYNKYLAVRLLSCSFLLDAEKYVIAKFKVECGERFTNNFENMLKDIELSKDLNIQFEKSEQSLLRMNVRVLTDRSWPIFSDKHVYLPEELKFQQVIFTKFYSDIHNGRNLKWQNSFGHCLLEANFLKEKKELLVSMFQTAVLMLFNDAHTLGFQDIKSLTGIEEEGVKRTLRSLACGKHRVLKKIREGRDVKDDDSFAFNNEFTSKSYRIKLFEECQMEEFVEDNTRIKERTLLDYTYQIEAYIVAIMKLEKRLSHELLVSKVLEKAKFPITQADVKKKIENLLEREYLERDKTNPNAYIYIS